MNIVCPIDDKDDAIQKVSSIVSSGAATGSFSGPSGGAVHIDGKWGYSGGYTTLHGRTITDLAKKLSPPEKPKLEGLGCLWIPIIYPGVILAGMMPFMLLSGIIGFLFNLTIDSPILLVITIPFGLFTAFSFIKLFLRLDRERKEESKKAIQKWEDAFKKWDELYYCFKHDVVFNPSTKVVIKMDDLSNYCGFNQ